ncbi:beta-propeller fold lactonase family protein [Telmatobacter bradus]|uniref:beta-propeller fold lactonase family protein n=1 Tax=Telmatobacter bradus TaxID=474953 RepID=UPI003B43BC12
MKFNKPSQLFLVSSIGLLVATLLSACSITTIDYAFVASSSSNGSSSEGQIQVFAVDSESGALRSGAATVDSGGIGPIALTVTSDYANLYVANKTSKTVVHFTIASNGTLTKQGEITLTDTPVALAVNAGSTFLYVLTGSSSATLSEYALSSGAIASSATVTKSLTLSSYTGDTILPTALAVSPDGGAVYATVYDESAYNPSGSTSSSAHPGWIYGFTIGSSGALTAVANSPYQAGVKPSAIAIDPTSRFVYVTDYADAELVGFGINSTNSVYTLTVMASGPFKTGNEPISVVVDPRGEYIYVANFLDNDVSAYTITQSSGAPSTIVNSTSSVYTTDTEPSSIVVDPALGRFVYTTNELGNDATGFRLSADTGAMSTNQASPYSTGYAPTSIAMVPHGNHSIQTVTK